MSFELAEAWLHGSAITIRAAAEVLSTDERRRAARFAFESDRSRFVMARATLRRLLATRVKAEPEQIEFTYGEQGKPALGGAFADANIFFNVAHCDDFALYAFSNDGEIGIDVEAVRWFADADEIASRMFSPAENEAYGQLASHEKTVGFYNCWTRKEAFVKALGNGLSRSLDSFDVTLAPAEPAKILRVESTPGDECGWTIESFNPAPGFVAAVVTENHGS